MNKLGFAIKSASKGAGNLFECNKDAWTNKVVDIRDYQKLFNGLSGSGKFITFLSFDKNGSFLVQLKTIAGRENDFLSGWIYIPNGIEIAGEDIEEAYNYVRQILCLSSISEKQDEINAYFAKEYSTKAAFSKNTPSSGDKFGYRKLGYFSMEEILNSDIYQEYYNGCKAIFLLEDNKVTISDEYAVRFIDFTNREIEKYCVLMPPTKETLRPFGYDTQIVDVKGILFDTPLRKRQGETVQLYATRKGFENIPLRKIEINESVVNFPLYSAVEWRKRINASMFHIVNRDGKIIRDATVKVCGRNITREDAIILEAEAKHAPVLITANGYIDYSETKNVLNIPIEITMHREEKSISYVIVMSNGKEANMTLVSKDLNGEIPLVGYSEEFGRDNNVKLVPSFWYKWKQRLMGFTMCIIVFFLIGGYYAMDAWIDSHEFCWGIPPWKEIKKVSNEGECTDDNKDSTSETASVAVIPYLDSNITWHKDSLEHYEETRGLFDALNDFDFSKVQEYESILSESKNFKQIIDTIKGTEIRGYNLHAGKEANDGKYNKASDKGINIDNYIKWISESHERPSETEPTEPKPVTGGKIKKDAKQNKSNTIGGITSTTNGGKDKKNDKSKRGGED